MRMPRNGRMDADARNHTKAHRTDVVRMKGGGIRVAILGISFLCTMIVEEIMGVMRVPVHCILVGMHLNHRYSGQDHRHKQQGENSFAHQV